MSDSDREQYTLIMEDPLMKFVPPASQLISRVLFLNIKGCFEIAQGDHDAAFQIYEEAFVLWQASPELATDRVKLYLKLETIKVMILVLLPEF